MMVDFLNTEASQSSPPPSSSFSLLGILSALKPCPFVPMRYDTLLTVLRRPTAAADQADTALLCVPPSLALTLLAPSPTSNSFPPAPP